MGAIDVDALRATFELDDRFVPVSVTALGPLGAPEQLSEAAREHEVALRTR